MGQMEEALKEKDYMSVVPRLVELDDGSGVLVGVEEAAKGRVPTFHAALQDRGGLRSP